MYPVLTIANKDLQLLGIIKDIRIIFSFNAKALIRKKENIFNETFL